MKNIFASLWVLVVLMQVTTASTAQTESSTPEVLPSLPLPSPQENPAGFTSMPPDLSPLLTKAYDISAEIPAAASELAVAEEKLKAAWRLFGPETSINISGTNIRARGEQNEERTSIDFKVHQNIYEGGATLAGVKAAKHQSRIAQVRFIQEQQKTLLNSIDALLTYMQQQAVLKAAKRNVAYLSKAFQAAQARFEVGLDTISTVKLNEASLDQAQAGLIEAEQNLEFSKANYVRYFGELPPAQPGEVPIPSIFPDTVENAISIASQENANLLEQKSRVKIAEAQKIQAQGKLLPRIDVNASAGRNNRFFPKKNTGPRRSNENSFNVEAVLSIPLDFRGSEQATLRSQKEHVMSEKLSLIKERRMLFLEIQKLWSQYHSNKAKIAPLKSQIEANAVALEQVQEEFSVGTKSITDILRAENENFKSQVELARTKREYLLSAYKLLATIGILTPDALKVAIKTAHKPNLSFWGVHVDTPTLLKTDEDTISALLHKTIDAADSFSKNNA